MLYQYTSHTGIGSKHTEDVQEDGQTTCTISNHVYCKALYFSVPLVLSEVSLGFVQILQYGHNILSCHQVKKDVTTKCAGYYTIFKPDPLVLYCRCNDVYLKIRQ